MVDKPYFVQGETSSAAKFNTLMAPNLGLISAQFDTNGDLVPMPLTLDSASLVITGSVLSAVGGGGGGGGGGTGAYQLPVGTTAQQPNTGTSGQIRFNSTTGRYEFGVANTWRNMVRLDGDTMSGALIATGLTATGAVLAGTGSANQVQLLGAAGSPAVAAFGASTNIVLNVKGKGTGGVNIQSGNGTVITALDDGLGVQNNGLVVTSASGTLPVTLNTLTTSGISVISPISFTRTWVRAGLWTDNLLTTGLRHTSTISGSAFDAGSSPINLIRVVDTVKAVREMTHLSVWPTVGAGQMGQRTGLSVAMDFTGQPTVPTAWLPSTSYALGAVVVNGGTAAPGNLQNVYQAIQGGISAGSGGPTGTGASIADNTVIWAYGSTYPLFGSYTGGALSVAAGFNLGGTAPTAALSAGSVIGGSQTAGLSSGATNYMRVISAIVGNTITAGASVATNVGLQIAHAGAHAIQGSEIDTALRFGDQSTVTAGWRNLITLGDYTSRWPLDLNGYLLQVQNNGAVSAFAAGGIDLQLLVPSGQGPEGGGFFWRSPGIQLLDTEAQIGNLSIRTNANGTILDTPYLQFAGGTGSIAVSTGGTDWTTNDIVADTNGNVFRVTAPSGTVTAVNTILTRGWSDSPPSGPVTFRARTSGGRFYGKNLTLNLGSGWTSKRQLQLGTIATDVLVGGNVAVLGAYADRSADVYTPVNDGNHRIPDNCSWECLTPAATITAFATIMPSNPIDKQDMWISTTRTITAWTLIGDTGDTVNDAPTTLEQGVAVHYRYNLATTTWFKLGTPSTADVSTLSARVTTTEQTNATQTTAINSNNASITSLTTRVQNLETAAALAAPPGIPGQPSVTATTATSVSLSTTAPVGGTAVANYKWEYKASDSFTWFTASGTAITNTISPLASLTPYDFRVSGVSAPGYVGLPSAVRTQSTIAAALTESAHNTVLTTTSGQIVDAALNTYRLV